MPGSPKMKFRSRPDTYTRRRAVGPAALAKDVGSGDAAVALMLIARLLAKAAAAEAWGKPGVADQ